MGEMTKNAVAVTGGYSGSIMNATCVCPASIPASPNGNTLISFGNHALWSSGVVFRRWHLLSTKKWHLMDLTNQCSMPQKIHARHEMKLRKSLISWERGDFLLLGLQLWLCRLVRGPDLESIGLKVKPILRKAHLTVQRQLPNDLFWTPGPLLAWSWVFYLVLQSCEALCCRFCSSGFIVIEPSSITQQAQFVSTQKYGILQWKQNVNEFWNLMIMI